MGRPPGRAAGRWCPPSAGDPIAAVSRCQQFWSARAAQDGQSGREQEAGAAKGRTRRRLEAESTGPFACPRAAVPAAAMPLCCVRRAKPAHRETQMTAGLAERRAVRTVLPVPEPDLTPAELIARAAALKPLLRQQQAENDERGFYSQELHQAFLDAGLYRTLQPRMFGGYEFDIPTFYRAMLEISHGHPSAGWCLTLCASHPFLIASHWSERAQRELFGPDGDFAAPHRVPPTGMLTPAEGGYRLSGLWDFCSGIPHSTHLVCGARLPVADGPPEVFCVAVPREKLRILDDWGGDRTLGMRASGSHSVEIKDAFDPGAPCGAAAGPVHPPRRHARRHAGNAAARQSDVSRARRRSLPHVADHAGHRRRQGGARRIPGSSSARRTPTFRRSSRAPSTRIFSARSARPPFWPTPPRI